MNLVIQFFYHPIISISSFEIELVDGYVLRFYWMLTVMCSIFIEC